MDISTRPTGLHASRNALLERARRWFIILSVWSDLPAFCRGADLSGYSFLRGGEGVYGRYGVLFTYGLALYGLISVLYNVNSTKE